MTPPLASVTTLARTPVRLLPPVQTEAPRHRRTALVIAHRGASGYRPEHTAAAYELAIRLGADAVEPDLVVTRDGVLLARHENEISGTTDVAEHPELADRRTTKVIDGVRQTGWFTEDLTLAELRTLRATERLGAIRPANRLYDGRWGLVTLDEVIAQVRGEARRAGRPIGLVLEVKHSTHFASVGLAIEPLLLATLERHGLTGAGDPDLPVWVESFETTGLRWLAAHCDLALVQLVEDGGEPVDLADTGTTYADLVTPRGLADVATYASGVAVRKSLVLPPATPSRPSTLVDDAHRTGLSVWTYTLRAENQYLPPHLRIGSTPTDHGDLGAEVRAHLEAGVDGVFTDFPDLAIAATQSVVDDLAVVDSWGTSTHATR